MKISEVNLLNFEKFTATFGNVVELCPVIAAAVWSYRPFKDVNQLQTSLERCVNGLPVEGILVLFFFINQNFIEGIRDCQI